MATKTRPATPTLPASISTVQDLKSLILEIRAYATWAGHESVKKRVEVASATTAPLLSPAASQLLGAVADGKHLDPKAVDKLLDDLQDIAVSAPRVNITLAAPPTKGIKTTLTDWCRQNLSPDILVSFDFSSTILGGMVVRYGSHVYDWSFRRLILADRAAFPQHLHPSD